MKKSRFILALLVLAVVFGWLLLFKQNAKKALPTGIPVFTNVAVQLTATNPVTNQQPLRITKTNKPDTQEILEQYRTGAINKGQALQQLALTKNHNLDLYGRVIDQYGQPVTGAKIQGDVVVRLGFMQQRDDVHLAQTDEGGNFSFLGFNGIGLGIWPQKAGYFYNLKLPSRRPDNYNPNPDNPVVFTMWKLRGVEPLENQQIKADIPYDGTSVTFNMLTGKEDLNGDLRISLSRFPMAIAPGLMHPYDWQFKLEVVGGGVLEEDDPYPYWAPDSGYEPASEFDVNTNTVPWSDALNQSFYFKNNKGQYGMMNVDLNTSSKHPETGIDIQIAINPSGSQNLEPAIQE
jgi:hypothetical protein